MSWADGMALRPIGGDCELMMELKAGNVAAFSELYDRYCDRAYRIALWICREPGHAQDAVQEAFLSVWRSSTSYQPQRGTVGAWLLTVVRHRAVDLVRSNQRHDDHRAAEDELATEPAAGDVCERAIRLDDAERLRASLTKLPDEQQEVILLAFFGQLSHGEIATHLGLPAGTVKGRMRLGLQKLRRDLDQVSG